jgi:nitrilase
MSNRKHLGGRDKVKVAIVQYPPMYMDKEESLEIACDAIIEAGREGAELIAFTETWLAGFPFWTEGYEMKMEEWWGKRELFQDNAVLVPSQDTDRLAEAAHEGNAHVVIGINEMDERPNVGTIYNALLFIDRNGNIMGTHRKLQPTLAERTFWGQGGAGDLKVFETDIGRIGGLICGEHWMPLVKAAIMMQGQDFHVGVWPGAFSYAKGTLIDSEPVEMRGESPATYCGRQYACDSNGFVLNGCGLYSREKISAKFPNPESLHMWGEGGSTIFGPSGQFLAGPDYKEGILYAECEAAQIKVAKAIIDALGHYARPDCFHFEILAPNRQNVVFAPGYERREAPENAKVGITRKRINEVAAKYDIDSEALKKAIEEILSI